MPKFIQKAVKQPGRLRAMLHKKPGEEITQAELNTLEAKARRTKNRSLMSAVQLARRFKSKEFKRI